MSDEELIAEILALKRGEPRPSGMPDPRMMTDAELERCLAELERLNVKWTAHSAARCEGHWPAPVRQIVVDIAQTSLAARMLSRPEPEDEMRPEETVVEVVPAITDETDGEA